MVYTYKMFLSVLSKKKKNEKEKFWKSKNQNKTKAYETTDWTLNSEEKRQHKTSATYLNEKTKTKKNTKIS